MLEWFRDHRDKKPNTYVQAAKAEHTSRPSISAHSKDKSFDNLKNELQQIKIEMQKLLNKPTNSPMIYNNAMIEYSCNLLGKTNSSNDRSSCL